MPINSITSNCNRSQFNMWRSPRRPHYVLHPTVIRLSAHR